VGIGVAGSAVGKGCGVVGVISEGRMVTATAVMTLRVTSEVAPGKRVTTTGEGVVTLGPNRLQAVRRIKMRVRAERVFI
jgi:hypothetical protein